jgi:hypothetical protein
MRTAKHRVIGTRNVEDLLCSLGTICTQSSGSRLHPGSSQISNRVLSPGERALERETSLKKLSGVSYVRACGRVEHRVIDTRKVADLLCNSGTICTQSSGSRLHPTFSLISSEKRLFAANPCVLSRYSFLTFFLPLKFGPRHVKRVYSLSFRARVEARSKRVAAVCEPTWNMQMRLSSSCQA